MKGMTTFGRLGALLLALGALVGPQLQAREAGARADEHSGLAMFEVSPDLDTASTVERRIVLAEAAISLSPTAVDTGSSAAVSLAAGGLFDLSAVKVSQIGVRPADGISNIAIKSQTA